MNVKLKDAPGESGPELNAPPVAVHVCVTVSLFVTVTVDPADTEMLGGLKAKLEMLIATCAGGTVVVVAGGGGGWVVGGAGGWVGGGAWIAAPGAAPFKGVPDEDGAADGAPGGAPGGPPAVLVVALFGALLGLSVTGLGEAFPAGFVDVVPILGSERLGLDVVVDRVPELNPAGGPLQAAVNVTSASPMSARVVPVLRDVGILFDPSFDVGAS